MPERILIDICEYTPPQGYFVDEAEAEAFDKEFPYKEKRKIPGQLF